MSQKDFGLKGNLLIVEDEQDLLEMLATTMIPYCDKIWTSRNGQEALDLIKIQKIDVIISDINMPVMDGLSLFKAIRAMGCNQPFIIHSAYGDKDNILEALRLGAFDFIEKPTTLKKIAQVISMAMQLGIKQRSLDDELSAILKKTG